jgi:hypothetical protein
VVPLLTSFPFRVLQRESAELGSAKTQQYIKKLEGETERLGKLVKDINAQLHASKVCYCLLWRIT